MPDGTPKPMRQRLLANEPSPRSTIMDAPGMPWQPSHMPGIETKLLYKDEEGRATLLFRLAPGAVVPLHEHTAVEQTYILEGSFHDDEGECGPGQFVWRPAGNTHVAWAGPQGCTILSIFLKPNHFAEGQKFFTEVQPE